MNNQKSQDILEEPHLIFSVFESFPIPITVFNPNGLLVFANTAFTEFFQSPKMPSIIGQFNLLENSVLNLELNLAGYLRRIFAGEILSISDVLVPFFEAKNDHAWLKDNPPGQKVYHDIFNFPLRRENQTITYIVSAFITKHIFQRREDVIKAKEYMDVHWFENFDLDQVAKYTNISKHHLARLFKNVVGITPYRYYQEIKVEKIKLALENVDLSINEAFSTCAADYGSFAHSFKRITGLTPSAYRKTLSVSTTSKQKIPSAPPFLAASAYGLLESEKQFFQVVELLPIPIQIFAANGDIVYINESVFDMWNVKDSSQIMGTYNLLKDPLANGHPELKAGIARVFRGEAVLIPDIRIPLELFWEKYRARHPDNDLEALYTHILNFPVASPDGNMKYIMSVFFANRVYQGKSEIARAKEYLENHWKEDFNLDEIAKATYLSPSHLVRLFKKHTGLTPYAYYREVKIERLKDVLRDENLTVAQAFIACGFEYPGNFARFFKKQVGLTPSQYRKSIGR